MTSNETHEPMMDLKALISQREDVPEVIFPISDSELLERFEKLYTGSVNDVLREFCLLDQALPGHILPLREYHTVAGFAFTVKSAPNAKITGEMDVRTTMLGEMHENAFVVWDTSNDMQATLWGGVMTATAKRLGVRAACIDGGIRDTHQILEGEFPVFYRYRISNGSLARCLITHYQTPIRIGGVDIKPGDVVVGDVDGVVIVPRQLAFAVLERAEAIVSNEDEIYSWVDQGMSPEVINARGGYF